MRELLQKTHSLPTNTNSPPRKGKRKSRGQSLVEMAISLPAILMLFSGLVEFGFMLNYYLSLLDATRFAARYYSNQSPYCTNGSGTVVENPNFYSEASATVIGQLKPSISTDNTHRIVLDPAADDVIISAYGVSGNTITKTLPTSSTYSDGAWHQYGNETSSISPTSIESQLVSGSPNQGILVVEVDYTYHQILGLPWMAWLGSPVLRAYTVMPLETAAPGSVATPPNC